MIYIDGKQRLSHVASCGRKLSLNYELIILGRIL